MPRPEEPLAAAWVVFHELPDAVHEPNARSNVRHWIDDWRLAPPIADAFRDAGLPEADAWRSVEAVKALLTLPAWDLDAPLDDRVAAILRAWLADDAARSFLQVNVHRDIRWFNREAFDALARWSALVERIRRPTGARETSPEEAALTATVEALNAAAKRSGYRLDALLAAVTTTTSG